MKGNESKLLLIVPLPIHETKFQKARYELIMQQLNLRRRQRKRYFVTKIWDDEWFLELKLLVFARVAQNTILLSWFLLRVIPIVYLWKKTLKILRLTSPLLLFGFRVLLFFIEDEAATLAFAPYSLSASTTALVSSLPVDIDQVLLAFSRGDYGFGHRSLQDKGHAGDGSQIPAM